MRKDSASKKKTTSAASLLKAGLLHIVLIAAVLIAPQSLRAAQDQQAAKDVETVAFGKGQLSIIHVASNAVRIRYTEGEVKDELPDWAYVRHETVSRSDIKVKVDKKRKTVTVKDSKGKTLFTATQHELRNGAVLKWEE